MCPGFHLSVAWEAKGVVGERYRERGREGWREGGMEGGRDGGMEGGSGFAIVLVTLWFVAQRSQAASHSCVAFFPLLQLPVNSDLCLISPVASSEPHHEPK